MQIEGSTSVQPRVAEALRAASETTGTSFDYLVSTAYRESTFRPELRATTSTATGLFQFPEQPWLELIKEDGPSVGLAAAASAIVREPNGRYTVADPATRQQILDLRNDPLVSSVMAGRFTQRNAASLTQSIGRTPSQQDLYVAHVLGATGGARLIRMAAETPNAAAAPAFPAAAAANVPIFYNRDGSARTAAEVYGFLAKAHPTGPLPPAGTATATAPRVPPAALADMIRAQVAARVSGESALGGSGGQALQRSLSQTTLPGEASGTAPPTGAALQGWRARMPSDAFSALLRTDTAGGPGLNTSGALGYADPGTAPATRTAPAQAGGPGVGQLPVAGALAAPRPSRMAMAALAGGAPRAPLPMVTSPLGVARPSRFSMAALMDGAGNGTTATDALRATAPAAAASPPKAALEPLSILPPAVAAAAPVRVRTVAVQPAATATAVQGGPATVRPRAPGQPLDLTRYMPLR
ncbi:lytic transglycosylase domain-containing protein [Prosthecomicrobium sp. N25]|uniref:lytic transglycosylase domain-containing protein n=1 Tax=Prosthecomicrobium sp. N25 TaxID=3129254 RepID=UPI0030785A80